MDIEYLLFLQNFRNSINDALTPFMEGVSFFAISYIIFVPVFIYWCLDKKSGLYIFFAWNLSNALNSITKLTCCIYRPWIRDARIIPAGNAIATAGGYSFPSGHTMSAVPIYGGLAVYARKLRWLMVIAILLTMFSRNYLGVHTPQDVVVGMILSLLSLYITSWLMKHDSNITLAICFILALAAWVYVNLKSYPMDYVDGKLLVDPVRMYRGSWADIGGFVVFIPAYYIEKRFVRFTSTGFNVKGVILCVIGLIPLYFMINYLQSILVRYTGALWGRFFNRSIMIVYIVVIWPLVLKLFRRDSNE